MSSHPYLNQSICPEGALPFPLKTNYPQNMLCDWVAYTYHPSGRAHLDLAQHYTHCERRNPAFPSTHIGEAIPHTMVFYRPFKRFTFG